MKLSHDTITMINTYYHSSFNQVAYDVLAKKPDWKLYVRVVIMLRVDLENDGLNQQEINNLMSKVARLGIRKAVKFFDGLVDRERLARWRLL